MVVVYIGWVGLEEFFFEVDLDFMCFVDYFDVYVIIGYFGYELGDEDGFV